MKNRLQFNRLPILYSGDTTIVSGNTTVVKGSGRQRARNELERLTRKRDFTSLIGEPIVVRYLDDEGNIQALLAIGKATGATKPNYHIIDTAEIYENLNSVSGSATEALTLASAATKDVANYLVILKNMIGEDGIDLDDGTYFSDDDPENCGLYKKLEGVRYIGDAKSMANADFLLDQALSNAEDELDALSAETVALSEAADGLEDKLQELSANTMAADDELADRIEALEAKRIGGKHAIVTSESGGNTTITLKINDNDKVLSQNEDGLLSTIVLDYVKDDKKIYLKGVDGEIISEINVSDFIKDGMLDHVNVFTATEEDHREYPELVVGETYLALYFNTDAVSGGTISPVFISVKDLVDIYSVSATSIGYLTIEGYEIRANVDVPDGLASYNLVDRISGITDNIIIGAGLNLGEQGTYPGHSNTNYINGANSLDEADVLLDQAIGECLDLVKEFSGITEELSANTAHALDEVNNRVSELSARTYYYVTLFSAITMEFSANTHAAIMELSARTVGASGVSQEYVDNAISGLSGNLITYIDSRISGAGVSQEYVDRAISGLSGNVVTYVNNAVNELSAGTLADIQKLSAGTIADNEKLSGDVITYVDQSVEALSGAILQVIYEDEEVTAASLNDLNSRVSTIETHMTGEYIPLTNYEISSGTTQEELTIDDDDTVNEAFGKIQKQILDDEEAIAAGMNALNRRIASAETAIAQNTGLTELSGAVMNLSAGTIGEIGNLAEEVRENYTTTGATSELSGETINLSATVMSLSAKTSGVLTINLNGVEQGKYSPSASTTLNLEAIQEVTGADVLLTGYELATGTTEEELAIVATDTVNEAFGKIQKQVYDNEAVTAGALNDLDERVAYLEANSGSSAGLEELSGAVKAKEYVIAQALNDLNDRILEISGRSVDLSDYYTKEEVDELMLSAGTFDPENYYTTAQTYNRQEIDEKIASGGTFDPNNYYDKYAINALSASMNNDIMTVSGDVASLSTSINTLSADTHNTIHELSASVVSNESKIGNVSGSVVANESKIEELSASVVTNKSNIEIVSGGLFDLSATLVADELVIAAAFNDLNDRVLELSGNSGGQANVQSDWDESDPTSDAYIKNKPYIPLIQKVTTAQYNAMEQAGTLDPDTLYILVD